MARGMVVTSQGRAGASKRGPGTPLTRFLDFEYPGKGLVGAWLSGRDNTQTVPCANHDRKKSPASAQNEP
jgi:hypothetical protein